MIKTLFNSDAYLTHFTANVIEKFIIGEDVGVVLDRTALFPEGGGQLADQGLLDNLPVKNVKKIDGKIVHVMSEAPTNQTIQGVVNWEYRYDCMQQHTGQHLLSAAFETTCGLVTDGFHMGVDTSHIDLVADEISNKILQSAELVANRSIYKNLPVKINNVDRSEINQYKLRKMPNKNFAIVRLVSIDGIDCCPCGGTHVARTGEIGLIKVLHFEKKNKKIRVHFVCGERALRNFQQDHKVLLEISAELSSSIQELPEAVVGIKYKVDAQQKQMMRLKIQRQVQEANELWRQVAPIRGYRVISHIFEGIDPKEVADLAKQIAQHDKTVALLAGIREKKEKAHIVFACSKDINISINTYLKDTLTQLGGSGGGSKFLAQGGCTHVDDLAEELDRAYKNILELLL